MAVIKPFAALRPQPELAGRICELPYDVMSSQEARVLAAGNPLSFLRVSKPEIDLPPDVDVHDARVYAKGRENFLRLIGQGALRREAGPAFYLYRQIMGKHAQVGLVAAASCQDYLQNIVKKHELTRPDKEDDRVRHIDTLDAQTGPVFLVYRAVQAMDDLAARETALAPDTDFTAADGVRHTAWALRDGEQMECIRRIFAEIPFLYIADGHHRCAAAARVYQARHGTGGSGFFLSVIFPDNQVRILPYNRVVKDLNGLTPVALLEKLTTIFEINDSGPAQPAAKHELALYLEGRWRRLRFRPQVRAVADAAESLDVTLLQRHVLAPVFGIDDPRASQRINFVGGIRGAEELEKLVNTKEYACAFALYPTGIGDLMAIADAGGIMPPKSTWFEPKLRDAMFCHRLGG